MPPKIADHIKEKAIQLRVDNRLTDSEIAERLKMPEATICSWLEDYPLYPDSTPAQKAAYQANRDRAAAKRQETYDKAWEQAPELFKDRIFHDFVAMYIGEGYKKDRNVVAMTNSNPETMLMSNHFIKLHANPDNKIGYWVQIHAEQNEDEIKQYWGNLLGLESKDIQIQRKSTGDRKRWNSEHGVLTIRIGDTAFRSKLEAWMDYLQKRWLDRFKKV